MSDRKVVKPVALAVGAALASSFAIGGIANADSIESPFTISSLSAGYMLGTGEGSCGGDTEGEGHDRDAEGSCGEGSCGGDTEGEGDDKDAEGSCGEGSCGGDTEGEDHDKDAEGSCGEGSCGGSV